MRRIADIRELARFLFDAGYRSAYAQTRLPPYQAAIQKAMSAAGGAFVDELGFVRDKDAQRLYLLNRIDFPWLLSQVELLPPLVSNEAANVVSAEWVEIRGGNEPPPSNLSLRKRPWWAFWS